MSKCINQMSIEDIVLNKIKQLYSLYRSKYDFDMECESVPYGDTYVNTNYYVTEKSEEKCLEDFKEDTTGYVIVEELYDDKDFCTKIEEMINNFKG